MGDFGGSRPVDLVPGSVRGMRAFTVRSDGRLTGVFHRKAWYQGENNAQCAESPARVIWSRGRALQHHVACEWCGCGFYAYFHSCTVSHANSSAVMGIVEGYGRVTFGDYGFRAEKARILAIYNPFAPKALEKPELIGTVLKAVRRALGWLFKPSSKWFFIGFWAALLVTQSFLITGGVAHQALWISQWVMYGIWLVLLIRGFRRHRAQNDPALISLATALQRLHTMQVMRSRGSHREALPDEAWTKYLQEANQVSELLKEFNFRAIQRMYPNIPMYSDMTQMVKDFAPTKIEELKHLRGKTA